MSDSFDSTVPNTPLTFDEVTNIVNKHGAFASLRPCNDHARDAFDATVNTIIKNITNLEHFRQFLYLDGKVPKGGSFYTEDEDDGSCHDADNTIWSGAFVFNLAVLPSDVPNWYLGTNQIPQKNDILLAPQSDHWKKLRVARRHSRLYHHHQSYRFMLEAYHSVIIGKNRARILTRSNSHVLEHGELIIIGACTYVFEYTDFSRTLDFETDLSKFAKKHFGSQSLHRYLSPTSVGDPVMLGNYYCSPSAFAKGTFGKVNAGWASNGEAVAIKTFKEPDENVIEAHKEIMRFIGRHVSHNIDVASDYANSKQDNIVELVHCVSHFNASVPDAYCVYTPLAVASLSDLIISYEVDIHAQITLLGAYANGLSYLHDEKGIMHMDISPNNLAVISFDPPQGMIIDLDTATKSQPLHNTTMVPFHF